MTNNEAIATRLPSTILVIDDEEPVLKRLVSESLDHTHLGMVTASTLTEAVTYFNSEIPIDALLVDLNFRLEAQDQDHQLIDGLDFVSLAQESRSDIPTFIITMEGDDPNRRAQARNKNLLVSGWFDKLSANQPGGMSVCEQIERKLIVDALKHNREIRSQAKEGGLGNDPWLNDDVVDAVRKVIDYPRVTYLQRMPLGSRLHVLKPIEVVCRNVHSGYVAFARHIPLLIEAEAAESPSLAIENLAELLETEKESLDSQEQDLVGFAAYIKSQLDAYLGPLL